MPDNSDNQKQSVHKKHTEILREYFNFLIKGCNDCKDNDRQIYSILDNVVRSVPKQLKKGKDYHKLITRTKSFSKRELSPLKSQRSLNLRNKPNKRDKDKSFLNRNKSKAKLGPGRFSNRKKIYNFNLKNVKSKYLGNHKSQIKVSDEKEKFSKQSEKSNDIETMDPEAILKKFLEIFTYGRNVPQDGVFQNILNDRSRGGLAIEEFKLENRNNGENGNEGRAPKTCACENKRLPQTERTNSGNPPTTKKDQASKSNNNSASNGASCKVNNTKSGKDNNASCKSGKGSKKDDQDKNQDEGNSACKRSDSPDSKPAPRFPPTLSPVTPCPVSKPKPRSCPSKKRNIQPEDVYVDEVENVEDLTGCGGELDKKCGKKEPKPKKCKRNSDDPACMEKPYPNYPINEVMQCIMESKDILNYWQWPLCLWRKRYCGPVSTFPCFRPFPRNLKRLPFKPSCCIANTADLARPWGIPPPCC